MERVIIEQREDGAWVAYNDKCPDVRGRGPDCFDALYELARKNAIAGLNAHLRHERAYHPYAGKIGPWARNGSKGTRYLDVGRQGAPEYKEILNVKPENGLHYFWTVAFIDGTIRKHVWCGTNTYERR